MPATMEPSSRTALPTPSVTSNATACHRLLAGDIGAACAANDASAVVSIAPNTTFFAIDLLLGFFALVSSIVPYPRLVTPRQKFVQPPWHCQFHKCFAYG